MGLTMKPIELIRFLESNGYKFARAKGGSHHVYSNGIHSVPIPIHGTKDIDGDFMRAKLSMICSRQDNGSFFAICPEITDCFTQGDTYEEAYTNLKELAEISLKEELGKKNTEKILLGKNKIFSEFEAVV